MSDQIVACPGCGKKFRIPDGAAPSGTFPCTACNATVAYGGASAGSAPRAAAPVARGAPASSGGRRGRRGRAARAEREEPDDGTGRGRGRGGRAKSGSNAVVLWSSLGVLAVIGVVVAVVATRKRPGETETATKPPATATPAIQAPVEPVVATPAPPPPAPAAPAAGTSGATKPEESSGIGGSKTTKSGVYMTSDQLFVRIADIPGITPQERETIDKEVALCADMDSGRAGVESYNKLRRMGRRAIPSLLSVFESHWKGKKWDDDHEKWAAFQIQLLLREIVKADLPNDFVARYEPRQPVAASDFVKAARMWVDWWVNRGGKDIEQFKDFPE